MKKLSILFAAMFILTFGVPAVADTTKATNGQPQSLLQQKMSARGLSAGVSKLLAQYQLKFTRLLNEIQYEYTVLDGKVKQSQNLTSEDQAALVDILENDGDYSYPLAMKAHKNILDNLPKDAAAISQTLDNELKTLTQLSANLKDYEHTLPQYYIYGDDSATEQQPPATDPLPAKTTETDPVKHPEQNDKAGQPQTPNQNPIQGQANGAGSSLIINSDKPLSVERILEIFSKMKPGDSVVINGQRIGYDKIKQEVQNIQSHRANTTTGSAVVPDQPQQPTIDSLSGATNSATDGQNK